MSSKLKLEAIKTQYQRFFARLRGVGLWRFGGSEKMVSPSAGRRSARSTHARALSQLRAGTPPRWPTAHEEILRSASEIAGLGDHFGHTGSGAPEIGTLWLVVFLVCAAIPLLSIVYKFTMSQELKIYYSVRAQARAGNPEAIALVRAHEALVQTGGEQTGVWSRFASPVRGGMPLSPEPPAR
ncbi:MAG: hypothetical protein IPI49_14920 [Myxococcales bacterium]|nr:hypothetical protein [Myxococcales bacterium]